MKETVKYIWPVLGPLRKYILFSLGLLLAGDIFGVYIPYLMGNLINEIKDKEIGNAFTMVSLAIVAMVGAHLVGWLREFIDLKKYFFHFNSRVERHASERVIRLSIGQHVTMNSGVVSETLSRGISSLRSFVVDTLFNLLPNIFYVTISLIAITVMSVPMGLTVATLSAVFLILGIRYNKYFEKPLLGLRTEEQKSGKLRSEIMRNIISVKLGGYDRWFVKEYNDEIVRVEGLERNLWIKYNFGANLLHLLPITITAVTLFLGLYMVKTGSKTAGELVMFFSWTSGVVGRLSSIRSVLRSFAYLTPSIKKYLELVNQKSDLEENGTKEKITFGGIAFKNVSFRYDRKDNKGRGISNVSFEIEPGQMVGIVGESGAGKSTVSKLILRAWDPVSGGIYIDGVSLPDYASGFRKQIAHVGQDGTPFDNTIRFNLTFGSENEVSDEELWNALEHAQLAERIRESKDGLDSVVGERGIRLSGGERQRLFLAQAMIRKVKILILDEATSHLDVNTEEAIFGQVIREASRGVTTLIVAHRFATLRSCHKILVMKEGKLVAFDTHAALMNSCAYYSELVAKQSLTMAN